MVPGRVAAIRGPPDGRRIYLLRHVRKSEYPRYFCECYAEVVEHTFRELSYQLLPREPSRQLGFFLEQLKGTTKRSQEEAGQALAANELTAISAIMWPGLEQEHLRHMVRQIDHR